VGLGKNTLPQIGAAGMQVKRLLVSVIDGPDKASTCQLEGDNTVAVGTAKDNELVIRDPLVSGYHLELRSMDKGIELRDLDSLNGTFVNDVRIVHGFISAGTRIRLGATTLAIEDGGVGARVAERPSPIPGIVGKSAAMQEVAGQLERIAKVNVSVLIRGETGTGKELISRAIHDLGPRKDKPFVVVDCGSMPAQLISSELFGHERGAFTSADRRHIGAFERADGGTIFLDEIGELPLEVQPALLGALERKRFRRVGGDQEIDVDVRVVAATHRDLRSEVNKSGFRSDLYFRLAAARVIIPPLRKRPEDIEPLIKHFVEEMTGVAENPFDATTMEALQRHRWTGNVRELRNVVESALAMGTVTLESPAARASLASLPPVAPQGEVRPYKEERGDAVTSFERRYLGRLIDHCHGNASEAARIAKMDRGYLLALLKKHGLR
jgi:DNA-binding NtrC family response regulator